MPPDFVTRIDRRLRGRADVPLAADICAYRCELLCLRHRLATGAGRRTAQRVRIVFGPDSTADSGFASYNLMGVHNVSVSVSQLSSSSLANPEFWQ